MLAANPRGLRRSVSYRRACLSTDPWSALGSSGLAPPGRRRCARFEKQSKKIKRCEVDGHCEIPSGGSLYRTRRNLRSPSLKFHVAAAWNERSPLAVLRLLRTTAGDRSRGGWYCLAGRPQRRRRFRQPPVQRCPIGDVLWSCAGSTRKALQWVMGYGEDQIAGIGFDVA